MYNILLNKHKEEIKNLQTMKERLILVADLISKHKMDDNSKWNRECASKTPFVPELPLCKLSEYIFIEKALRNKAEQEDYSLLDENLNNYNAKINYIISFCKD